MAQSWLDICDCGGLGLMPAGDAQRVWFPEMIEELKISWLMTMPWEALADFHERMTQKRKQIRRERGTVGIDAMMVPVEANRARVHGCCRGTRER